MAQTGQPGPVPPPAPSPWWSRQVRPEDLTGNVPRQQAPRWSDVSQCLLQCLLWVCVRHCSKPGTHVGPQASSSSDAMQGQADLDQGTWCGVGT